MLAAAPQGQTRPPAAETARAASAEIRSRQGLHGGFHPHLRRRCAEQEVDRARHRADQEAGHACAGSTPPPRRRRSSPTASKIYSLRARRQAGHPQPDACRRRGDHRRAVPRRQGQPDARLQRQLRGGRRRRHLVAAPRSEAEAAGLRLADRDRRSRSRCRSAGSPPPISRAGDRRSSSATTARTRVFPTACSSSRFREEPMSSLLAHAAEVRRAAIVALAALIVSGCASTGGSMKKAREAELRAGLRPRGRRVHEDRARQPGQHRRAHVARARQAAGGAGAHRARRAGSTRSSATRNPCSNTSSPPS